LHVSQPVGECQLNWVEGGSHAVLQMYTQQALVVLERQRPAMQEQRFPARRKFVDRPVATVRKRGQGPSYSTWRDEDIQRLILPFAWTVSLREQEKAAH
jgi:hypothetical protein